MKRRNASYAVYERTNAFLLSFSYSRVLQLVIIPA
jgi:hypothetical protein